jgi:hypothetical protein
MPRKSKKAIQPPSKDVAEKQKPGFSAADFDRASSVVFSLCGR